MPSYGPAGDRLSHVNLSRFIFEDSLSELQTCAQGVGIPAIAAFPSSAQNAGAGVQQNPRARACGCRCWVLSAVLGLELGKAGSRAAAGQQRVSLLHRRFLGVR